MGRINHFVFSVFAALAAAATAPASAGDDDVRAVAVGARLAATANGALITFDLSRPVEARAHTLSGPDRIIVDLPEVVFRIDPGARREEGAGPVRAFRFGRLAPGKSRIVIALSARACPVGVASRPIVADAAASRLTIDIEPCDDKAFEAAALPAEASAPPPQGSAPGTKGAAPPAQAVIVLDPGHGGVDSGARGVGGALEKTLTLAFCAELKRQLEASGRYRVLMTRDSDQYVDLDARVDFARAANAALFVSIHADTLNEAADVGGSTVYTVGDRASDAEAARVAEHENAADRDPGKVDAAEADPGVADILFDLKRRETLAYSRLFSRRLVDLLGGATRLNRNPERSAGFVVLKAPEFPSVLVELGYLSNPQDVAALTSPDWRARTAAAMARAIDAFFAAGAPADPASASPGVALGPEKSPSSEH